MTSHPAVLNGCPPSTRHSLSPEYPVGCKDYKWENLVIHYSGASRGRTKGLWSSRCHCNDIPEIVRCFLGQLLNPGGSP